MEGILLIKTSRLIGSIWNTRYCVLVAEARRAC